MQVIVGRFGCPVVPVKTCKGQHRRQAMDMKGGSGGNGGLWLDMAGVIAEGAFFVQRVSQFPDVQGIVKPALAGSDEACRQRAEMKAV